MAEPVKHTCAAAQNWGQPSGSLPNCQACNQQFIELCDKEREALEALRDFIGTDSMKEYERLLRVGREYVELRSRSLRAALEGSAR